MAQDTGGSDDADVDALAAKFRQLQLDYSELTSVNQALEAENQSMKVELQNMKGTLDPSEELEEAEALSEDAARKRLERLCKRNKKGPLASRKLFLPPGFPLHLNPVSM